MPRWALDWFSGLTLRTKVVLGVVIPLTFVLGIFTAIEYSRHQAGVLSNLSLLTSHSAGVIESNLRQQMLESDFDELQELLDSIDETGDFRVVYLLNTSGKVIFAPEGRGVGMQLSNSAPDCQPCHRLPPEQRPKSVIVEAEDGQRVFRSMNPIVNSPDCAQCHGSDDRLIGLLLTDIPVAPVEKPLFAHMRENLLWWLGTLAVVVLVVNMGMSRLVLGRLEKLSAAMKGFGQGQPPHPVEEGRSDEIGQLASSFYAMTLQVEKRTAENLSLSENLKRQNEQRGELLRRLITAQEDERKRLARELHDELGQSLGGLAFRTEAIQRLMETDPKRASEELQVMRTMIKESTDQMYDLILALRPSILDDLGLVAAVRAHGERLLKGTGIDFNFQVEGVQNRLPAEVETTLYRVFQEALNNVVRHSEATRVDLRLLRSDGLLEAEIVDDGMGFDPDEMKDNGNLPRGLGLAGILERVTLVGGSLEVCSEHEHGTCLRIAVPLEEDPNG